MSIRSDQQARYLYEFGMKIIDGKPVDTGSALSEYREMGGREADLEKERVRAECISNRLRQWQKGHNCPIKPSKFTHKIEDLKPAPNWTLGIDETGKNFYRDGGNGKVVGILYEKNTAPGTPGDYHATECCDINEHDKQLQKILNSNVGIFGLAVDDLPELAGHQKSNCVIELIDWVLRLIPLTEQTCKLKIEIEEGALDAAEYRTLAKDRLSSYAREDSGRASKIEIASLRVIQKGTSAIAAADAVAYLWGMNSDHSEEAINRSGLIGTCLQPWRSEGIKHAYVTLKNNQNLSADRWRELLNAGWVFDSKHELIPSLATDMLAGVGKAVKINPSLWENYVDAVADHLNSKAINFTFLGKEIDWLKKHIPDGKEISDRLLLIWSTAQLAYHSNKGATVSPHLKEVQKLSKSLYKQHGDLCILSSLYQYSFSTNSFNFENAAKTVENHRDIEEAIPGTQFWARLQSTYGQIEAFKGKHLKAQEYFKKAIDGFSRIGESTNEIEREKIQTKTYLAISVMDDETSKQEEILKLVEELCGNLEQAALEFSTSNEPSQKYLHAMLLRYFYLFPGFSNVKVATKVYLNNFSNWKYDNGHPWELIFGYQSLLLKEAKEQSQAEARRIYLPYFYRNSPDHAIGLIVETFQRLLFEVTPPKSHFDTLTLLESKLPAAKERIKILRSYSADKSNPRELLNAVLPFNFH